MPPSTCRHSEEEWLSRKLAIRDMFLRDGLSLRDIIQSLESDGFSVKYELPPFHVTISHICTITNALIENTI
jgi:hypothetical protein